MKSAGFPATLEQVDNAIEFISTRIKDMDNDKIKRNETTLICEELLLKMIEVSEENAEVKVQLTRRGQDIKIRLECAGDPVNLDTDDSDDIGGRILSGYSDKIRQSYRGGSNTIEVLVWTSANQLQHLNLVVALSAAVCGIGLHYLFLNHPNALSVDELLFTPGRAYLNVFGMFSPFAAFFILAYLIAELINKTSGKPKMTWLGKRYILTSILCVLWGLVAGTIMNKCFHMTTLTDAGTGSYQSIVGDSLTEFFHNLTSYGIFELFSLDNPLPMLLLAIIFGLTVASTYGLRGKAIKSALDTSAEFMCSIIHLLYQIFPIVLFFAIADIAYSYGLMTFPLLLLYITFALITLALVLLLYMLSLLRYKVSLRDFWKQYKNIIKANFQIASNKDALSYNKRVLRKRTSLSDTELNDALRLGILLNMDGSSVMIALITSSLFAMNALSFAEAIEVIALIMLLSLGTPNQPGTLFVAPVILVSLFSLDESFLNLIIVMEAFTGKYYSFINALGDIVSIAIIDQQYKTPTTNKVKS